MMSQLSHKHLLLNYGVCVCGNESKSTSCFFTYTKKPTTYWAEVITKKGIIIYMGLSKPVDCMINRKKDRKSQLVIFRTT